MARRIDLPHVALRGPGVSEPAHYAKRVRWLAVVHVTLFVASLAGISLLIWRGEFFVTLSQRSNVETLTIAFHTYATELLAAGMSLPGVMRLLGHHDFRMTLRYTAITAGMIVSIPVTPRA